jgi:hypothetical protein
MSRTVTIAGRFVERTARLIATRWSAAIGAIFLLQWVFDVVPAAGALAGATVQRLGGAPARVDCAALNQTPLVHGTLLLTDSGHGSYSSPATAMPTHPTEDLGEAPATASHECDGLDGGDDAVAFERELGDRLFHDPRAVAVARRTAERLFDVIRVLHTELYPGTDPGRMEQIFFSDKLTNPGQVGRGVVTLPELLREGNLRMVMTALLNAIHDSEDTMTLEITIQELLKRPGWEEIADRAGLDVPRLHALKELVDAGHGVFTVLALGSHSPDTRDAVTECIASQTARWRRTLADREAYRWTSQEFANRGIALHPLEIAAQRSGESANSRDVFEAPPTVQHWSQQIATTGPGAKPAAASQPVDDPEPTLHWLSGRALFGIDTEAPWFRTVSVERGFPVTTGISGCAARLHSVFIWIQPEGVSEHEFTRALIGWILPSDHHSLYEIIRGIQIASPHLFHEPGNGFADVSDLYRRAPWASSHEEEEHRDSA